MPDGDFTLTGGLRYRTQRRRGYTLLVLQVEIRVWRMRWAGGIADGNWCIEWRDAKVEDLTGPALRQVNQFPVGNGVKG